MMLPMRISVSVTPAARAGCTAVKIDANSNAAKKAGDSHFILVLINAASSASCSELVTPPSDDDDSAGDQVVKRKCWLIRATGAAVAHAASLHKMRRCGSGVFDVRYTFNSGAHSNVAGYPSCV
jgi:hypothetical protein